MIHYHLLLYLILAVCIMKYECIMYIYIYTHIIYTNMCIYIYFHTIYIFILYIYISILDEYADTMTGVVFCQAIWFVPFFVSGDPWKLWQHRPATASFERGDGGAGNREAMHFPSPVLRKFQQTLGIYPRPLSTCLWKNFHIWILGYLGCFWGVLEFS